MTISRNTKNWLFSVFFASCISLPIWFGLYLLDWSTQQTREAMTLAESWHAEALKWRAIASQSSQGGMCAAGTFKCDAEKCWHVCTGAPAMDVKP